MRSWRMRRNGLILATFPRQEKTSECQGRETVKANGRIMAVSQEVPCFAEEINAEGESGYWTPSGHNSAGPFGMAPQIIAVPRANDEQNRPVTIRRGGP